jgi:hypothetical protein
MLRHSAGTKLCREFGLGTAWAVLCYATSSFTEVYAERDQGQAAAMLRIG